MNHPDTMKRRMVIYLICLTVLVIIFGSILFSPWLVKSGGFLSAWGIAIHWMCGRLCHQDPGRSYHPVGIQMAVCHRCAGLYTGILFGLIIYPFSRYFRSGGFPSVQILFLLAAPMLADVLLNLTGVWEGVSYFRTFTGLLIGIYLGLIVVNGFDAAFDQMKHKPVDD